MTLQIVAGDITKQKVDAIVNAANETLLGGGGVDGCIHRGAGPKLLEECKKLGGCSTGEAKITKGYDLPCNYIIHTVGPIYSGEKSDAQLLRSCYLNSLELAKKWQCQSIAFPLISAGIYGYPKAEALSVATKAIKEFLKENDMTVYLVLFKRRELCLEEQLAEEIKDLFERKRNLNCLTLGTGSMPRDICLDTSNEQEVAESLEKRLAHREESFVQVLLRKIKEANMTEVECYKKANIDRKLFSKIRSDINYRPKKSTVIAFAIALELDVDETDEFLKAAGYALTNSSKFDIIVEYFIDKGIYDIYAINEVLFSYNQALLGARD